METNFQSVFAPYPNHSEGGAARHEFQKIDPGNELLAEMQAALNWQIPAFDERARKAGTVRVVPHFRRWLHNEGWKENVVDDYGRPKPESNTRGPCARCGFTGEQHGFAHSRVAQEAMRDYPKDFGYLAEVCAEFQGKE